MPTVASTDGTKLYYEEAGIGTPVVFVHEFAGDYRTWEPQLRDFSRSHRCVTFSARGYPPSEVPTDPARYGQDIARGDVIGVMDALGIKKAHVVGHSMGAYTALHVGIRHPERCISVTAAGCGWGSVADPAVREAMRKLAVETPRCSPRMTCQGGGDLRRHTDPPRPTNTRIHAASPSSPACSASIPRTVTR